MKKVHFFRSHFMFISSVCICLKLYWTRTPFYSHIGHSVNYNTRIKLNCFCCCCCWPTILFVFFLVLLCVLYVYAVSLGYFLVFVSQFDRCNKKIVVFFSHFQYMFLGVFVLDFLFLFINKHRNEAKPNIRKILQRKCCMPHFYLRKSVRDRPCVTNRLE